MVLSQHAKRHQTFEVWNAGVIEDAPDNEIERILTPV
jgi:hypothetical protein